jgi:sulfopyruvate decarboxylase subunit alpha
MPVSVTNSKLIYDALKACDVKIISALPETWLVHLIRMADEDPDMILVRIAKEEGYWHLSRGTFSRRQLRPFNAKPWLSGGN